MLFGSLYAFEHNNQVTLYNYERTSSSAAAAATGIGIDEASQAAVYTPTSNIIIMAMNLCLAILVVQITVNVDSQIEHIQAPTFLPQPRLQVRPTYRYRYLYWSLTFLVVLFILCKDHGQTVVEHPWFIFFSLCALLYAPFWLTRAVSAYEEHVQEQEIGLMDKQALQVLD